MQYVTIKSLICVILLLAVHSRPYFVSDISYAFSRFHQWSSCHVYNRCAPTELIIRRDRPEDLGNIFASSVVISRLRNDNICIKCKGQR